MGRVGWSESDYKAISVQLQLQLPTGTELGNRGLTFLYAGNILVMNIFLISCDDDEIVLTLKSHPD